MTPLPKVTLDALRELPEVLRRVTRGLTEEQWHAKPPDGEMSLVEVLNHLEDYEAVGFIGRTERMLSQADPHFADFDAAAVARQRQHDRRDPERALAAFEALRARSVAMLGAMAGAELNRPGRLASVGAISVRQLVDIVLDHDAGHRAEAEALLAHVGRPVETTRTIVAALIRNAAGGYLLCRMPPDRGVFPGQWGIPGGGIEPGEAMEAALRREVEEEVGLALGAVRPLLFYDDHRVKRMTDGSSRHIYMVYLVFECEAASEQVQLNQEFAEYAWVEPQHFARLDLNAATRTTLTRGGLLPARP